MQPNKKARIQVSVLLLVFILPAIIGWYLFHYHERFQFKTVNRGVLINPPLPVQDLLPQGRKWQIAYLPNHCDSQTEKMMYTLHQMYTALGKDRDRVDLTLVGDASCQTAKAHDFRKLLFTSAQYAHLQTLFSLGFLVKQKIYLVDPLGNVFMFYPETANPMDILKDLKHVLGVSQLG